MRVTTALTVDSLVAKLEIRMADSDKPLDGQTDRQQYRPCKQLNMTSPENKLVHLWKYIFFYQYSQLIYKY